MFEILSKKYLNEFVIHISVKAPLIAKKALPGQFVILKVDEKGERIPLTIFKADKKIGIIELIYQKLGTTTLKLSQKGAGDFILDLVGPLGKPSQTKGYANVLVVSGGVANAISCPIAESFKKNGSNVEMISGFRNKSLIILEDEIRNIDNKAQIVTDDGSNGKKALVTNILQEKLSNDKHYDLVLAIGPIMMMSAVCNITKKFGIKTIVSMNSIMIDGTGMCGGCRVLVNNEVKFACIDGPEFDGHMIDFKNANMRNAMFINQEKKSKEKYCNLFIFKGV